ncbi:coiled-coil domain-containing protein [Pigmentibacter ruber]|uniref:hypothetical protein n=1 Tax=Pigmentibacter ruber TaxID=2683196 RepID=UPI00131DED22|nr:hypothetical protein [Pigmentibacter ruber]
MLYTPSIIIRQLKLYSINKLAYNQKFHYGLNIIRSSHNSTGKSSILNFIYYILGGNVYNWTYAAQEIEFGLMEVELNNAIYTLFRSRYENKEPTMIYDITLSEIEASNFEFMNENKKEKNKTNYNKRILEILKIPNLSINENRSIRIQDLLCLIYSDQDSSVNSIFKNPENSNELIRKSIAELLLFRKSESLIEAMNLLALKRKKQINIEKYLKVFKENFDNIKSIHYNKDFLIDATKIKMHKKIENLMKNVELKMKSSEKNEIKNIMEIGSIEQNGISDIENNIINSREEFKKIKQDIKRIKIYLEESEAFISALNERRDALNISIDISNIIENADFKYCPSCFTENTKTHYLFGHCVLCKNHLNSNVRKYSREKALREIEFQINESKKLKTSMETEKNLLERKKYNLNNRIKILEKRFCEIYKISDVSNAERDQTLIEIGITQGELKSLDYLEDIEKNFFKVKKETKELHNEILKIKENIAELNETDLNNQSLNFIHLSMKKILDQDINIDDTFKYINDIQVSFNKNKIVINNSKISASSQVVLKNALHLAILELSLSEPKILYPRLLLLDNIDDKGMTQQRSHNFQKIIQKLSIESDVKHQIIMTTTQIAKELNDERYCIGPNYDINLKTLNL